VLQTPGNGLRRKREAFAVDGSGLPMRVSLTGGQAGDNPQLLPLLDGIQFA
jgi:transposase